MHSVDKKDKFCPGMAKGYNTGHVPVMRGIVFAVLYRETGSELTTR